MRVSVLLKSVLFFFGGYSEMRILDKEELSGILTERERERERERNGVYMF